MKKESRIFTQEDRLAILQEAQIDVATVSWRENNLVLSLHDMWKNKYLSKCVESGATN